MGNAVSLMCLQSCASGRPNLCQPSLFLGTAKYMLFCEAPKKVTLSSSCSYYNYSLVDLNVMMLEGQNLSCGGTDRDGTLNVSNPLQLSVKPGELLL